MRGREDLSFLERMREPGTLPAAAVVAVAFLLLVLFVTGPIFLVAGFFGWTTAQFLKAAALAVGAVLIFWGALASGQIAITGENSIPERFLSWVFRREEPRLEVDDAPARLARKRGKPADAVRIYEDLFREHPDHLELLFHAAEITHHDLSDRVAAHRGYLRFLAQVDGLERALTADEARVVPLARSYLADLKTEREAPAPRRIQV